MKKFTLIELLIVVAIIGILVTLLMPSLWKAREMSKRTVCSSNQHQNTMAFRLYASDNSSNYPSALPTGHWSIGYYNSSFLPTDEGFNALVETKLVTSYEVFICPSNQSLILPMALDKQQWLSHFKLFYLAFNFWQLDN